MCDGGLVVVERVPRVSVYWRPGCVFCLRLRLILWWQRLHPEMINIWRDPDAAAFVRSVADGNETVPTVVIDGEAFVNPPPLAGAPIRDRPTGQRCSHFAATEHRHFLTKACGFRHFVATFCDRSVSRSRASRRLASRGLEDTPVRQTTYNRSRLSTRLATMHHKLSLL